MITKLMLTSEEARQTQSLLGSLAREFNTPEDTAFLHDAVVSSHELPQRVRRFLNDFRLKESADAAICIISGYPIDNSKIGLTPLDRSSKNDTQRTLEEQMLLVLCGSLLGDPVGWSTQQAGHMVHDISPVKGQETDQTGSSSKEELYFHTEDAFHPYRGDYLGMMCLRNERQAATRVASSKVLAELPEDVIRILFQPRFAIRPDASQFEKHRFAKVDDLGEEDFETFCAYSDAKIHKMQHEPEPIAILFGNTTDPYIRVDCSVYMDALDPEADAAIQVFTKAFNAALVDLELESGEICFIDNFRAVHGRTPFKYPARYDGNDRWMKRINLTRDLRKSRDMRMTSTSRIIF
ncbi:guanitoxin biosynthesis L-enduracididine beta-hydroxylase GntD [Thiothrix lacustris]|uniref:guanitoxin biosynthesis L-enduracididine beta-hydroxylase GntD n=1 Tax=Thiothrix lacustris TaxID=525917 RepID=UPI0027E445CF|nr:guanitoxin biosynthesis L-enduracididine beta-hydroxylase GntD [Thiothrix lacustris]WMP19412.1 guanitoxin biosynthesis L-enduracididine beta-hydroxylase GntD [Thiothrix lacustris]